MKVCIKYLKLSKLQQFSVSVDCRVITRNIHIVPTSVTQSKSFCNVGGSHSLTKNIMYIRGSMFQQRLCLISWMQIQKQPKIVPLLL